MTFTHAAYNHLAPDLSLEVRCCADRLAQAHGARVTNITIGDADSLGIVVSTIELERDAP